MAKMLATTAVAALVGAAVAIGVGLIGLGDFRPFGIGKKMAHATIYVDEVGGNCKIHTAPQTLEAFKRETVQWSVVNRCPGSFGNEVFVDFRDGDPLLGQCGRRGRKKIECTIRNDAGARPYKYWVTVTGADPEDPDLEIVQ